MSDDPNQPADHTPEVESEDVQDLGGGASPARGTGGRPGERGTGGRMGGTGGFPEPGGTAGIVFGGTGGLQGGTGGFPIPGGTGGIVMGGTGGIITVVAGGTGGHTITVVLGPDGRPKPGRYRLEVHHTADFEVLDNGHVVIHRQSTEGGTPEPQG